MPCPACGGEPVVSFERLGAFGYASGAPTLCLDCKGARVAHCGYRLTCRGVPATRLVDGLPCCEGCAEELALEASECCFYCGDGTPVAPAGPQRAPACERCIDAFHEIGSADTLPPAAAENERAEAALVELCTGVLA